MDLIEQQRPLDEAIAREVVALTPEWWRRAVLKIEQAPAAEGTQLSFQFTSPEGHKDAISVSGELVDAAVRLLRIYVEYGRPWTAVVYAVEQSPDERWRFSAEFEY